MSDPRLNSLHLRGSTRLDDYRRARERLMDACGAQTLDPGAIIAADESARTLFADDPSIQTPVGPTQLSGFWLVDRDAVYPLKIGLNTVGRMPDNDVAILDAGVSRRHCVIVVHIATGCEIHDVASKNGTYLNGRRLAGKQAIRAGDELRLCDRLLMFLKDDQNGPPKPLPAHAPTQTERTARLPP